MTLTSTVHIGYCRLDEQMRRWRRHRAVRKALHSAYLLWALRYPNWSDAYFDPKLLMHLSVETVFKAGHRPVRHRSAQSARCLQISCVLPSTVDLKPRCTRPRPRHMR